MMIRVSHVFLSAPSIFSFAFAVCFSSLFALLVCQMQQSAIAFNPAADAMTVVDRLIDEVLCV